MLLVIIDMVHPYMFPKVIMSVDVKSVKPKHDVKPDEANDDVQSEEANDDVKPNARPADVKVDVPAKVTNKETFFVCEHMLQQVCREAGKLRFGVVIGRPDNGSDRRQAFVTTLCERSDTYQANIRKLKRGDTRSRKCECPFKLCGYRMEDETWKLM